MLTTYKLYIIIMSLLGGSMHHKEIKAREYSQLIMDYSAAFNIDPILTVSVIERESGFDEYTIGKRNERGLMQILPHSSASRDYDKFGKRALFDPGLNIYLGTRHLAFSRLKCHSDNMGYYLSFYNGFRKKNGHCYKTPYSQKVLQTYRQLLKQYKGL